MAHTTRVDTDIKRSQLTSCARKIIRREISEIGSDEAKG